MTTSNPIAAGAPNTNDGAGGLHENTHDDIEALGPWITIERKRAAEKTKGGVILPDTVRAAQEAEYVGVIINMGGDVAAKKPLQVGDRIIYTHCFPMNKAGSPDVIYSLVHVDNVMGRVHSSAVKPAMAPKSQAFKQG